MTDRDALLAAVHAQPLDDAPRLVLADWLDEHGQPERAEFIRIQVAMRREHEANGRTDRLERLFVRSREVLYHPWAEPVRQIFGRGVAEYSRGFPRRRHIELACAEAVDVLASIASWLGPGTDLALHDCHGRLKELAGLAELGCVPGLEFTRRDDEADVTDADAADLLASPYLGGLRSLCLDNLDLSDVTALALRGATSLRSLEWLSLAGNQIGPAGATALARAGHLATLEYLDLSKNRIGTPGAEALLKSRHLSRLKTLDVRTNRVSAQTMKVIRNRFPKPRGHQGAREPLWD